MKLRITLILAVALVLNVAAVAGGRPVEQLVADAASANQASASSAIAEL